MSIQRACAAEAIGTAFLLLAIVGSGIMGERLAAGNPALILLANSLATGAALAALIAALGPISGAHFNPAITVATAAIGRLAWRSVPWYVGGQIAGAVTGVALAHAMFGLSLLTLSTQHRSGPALVLSEVIATFGLLAVVWGCSRYRPGATPFAIGAYIAGAYWFTASTSFANPAVTIARALTNTFAGISPDDVAGFILAQSIGAAAATWFFTWLAPSEA